VIPIFEELAGRYRVDGVLGQGGMGIVVKATHLQLHQAVAMKFLLPEVLGNQQIVQRFLREAQAAVRLKSEHVARVIDVGSLESGAPYMVLEYLDGADLSNVPRAQLSLGGIIDLVLQACEALAEAHSLGIVHRDIKPANFFITRGADGAPLLKVLDFGISKTPVVGSNLTATQSVMGTPAYMSPEQMRSSRDVDHRSDIWALGVVLYELLQGAPPFGGDTFSSMVIKVVTEALPPMTVALPGELAAIVYRCLEKDPARRFQNVAELALALAPYAQTATQASISVARTRSIVGLEAPRSVTAPGGTRRAHPPSTLSGAAGASTQPPTGRRRWPIVAGLGAIAGAVAIAVIASSNGGGGGAGAMTPAARPELAAPASPIAATPPAAPQPPVPATNLPPSPAPAVTTPPSVSTQPSSPPPAAVPPQAATAQAAPPDAAAADPAPVAVTTPTTSVTPTTKPAKPPKPKPGGHRLDGSAARPASADDDVLGTRN
jgi:serine/threonine-protein kinase